ncbi:MAG: J domain-containing protein [Halapricum sp.]
MAAAFAGMTVLFALVGVVYNPVILAVAVLFGGVTYLLWAHGSGRMASRLYERVERQAAANTGGRRRRDPRRERGGFGAGPREDWEPPGGRASQRARDRRQRVRGRQADPRGQRRSRQRAPRQSDGPTAAEAYRTLDLDPGADQQAIKQAYREKVKTAHPDTDDGDREQFKEVKAAYERLREE